MKVNLGKTIVMIIGHIAKDILFKGEVYHCGFCSLRVVDNSVLCVQCGGWIRKRCAGVKRLTQQFLQNVVGRKCEGNLGEVLERKERLFNEIETIGEFAYLGNRMSAGGGCEAAVTARVRCWWVKLRKCGEILYWRRFSLMWLVTRAM